MVIDYMFSLAVTGTFAIDPCIFGVCSLGITTFF